MIGLEARPSFSELTPQRISIPAQTLFRSEEPYRHKQQGGERYSLEVSLLNPKESRATILFIHGASAPTSMLPLEKYAYFQQEMAKVADATTVVYDSRSVSVERSNFDYDMKTFRTPKGDEYKGTSINDRIDDAVNTLFWLTMQPNTPEKIVLAGVSMGGHVAVRLLDRLEEVKKSDPNLENRILAAAALQRIGGLIFLAPAAYAENIEDLPTRSSGSTPHEQTRTYLLRNISNETVAQTSPVFRTLESSANMQLPLFLTY